METRSRSSGVRPIVPSKPNISHISENSDNEDDFVFDPELQDEQPNEEWELDDNLDEDFDFSFNAEVPVAGPSKAKKAKRVQFCLKHLNAFIRGGVAADIHGFVVPCPYEAIS